MIRECSFRYPDGRNCHRIPRRGQSLCPDHRRQAAVRLRQDAAEQAFRHQATQAGDEIIRLPLNRILDHAQECLMHVETFIEANASAALRLRFMRAMTAITVAIDCVDSQAGIMRETVPNLPEDGLNAMMALLWYARPNYAAQAQALGGPQSPDPGNSIHNVSLQNQLIAEG